MQNHSSVPWWRTRTGIAVVGFGLVMALVHKSRPVASARPGPGV